MNTAAAAWKICTAPAGGCGFGPRKKFWTSSTDCDCGSPLKLAKQQPPPPQPEGVHNG